MSTPDVAKHVVPTGPDGFRRQNVLDLSLSIHDTVPVANATERATVLAALVAAGRNPATSPVYVDQLDIGAILRNATTSDSNWYAISDRQLSVLKSGLPGAKTLPGSSTVDLIASGDTGGIPSVTPSPGGRIKLDLSFQYVAGTAGTAAASNLQLLVDGATNGPVWLVHTGLGAAADVLKQYTVTLEGWLSPGTAHTINARLTWTGGGPISVLQISYALRG